MNEIDTILSLIKSLPEEILQGIAARVKRQRLSRQFTQAELAQRADIPLPTYRRFERTGEISLRNLLLIAVVLGETEDFTKLFSTEKYGSIDDVLNTHKQRKRGKRNG